MNVYLDTSVVLSHLLHQPNRLKRWGEWSAIYTSVLTKVEFLRTVDRLRLAGEVSDRERVDLHNAFSIVWNASYRVDLSQDVLDAAAMPMPTVMGTLDAIHLATAVKVRDSIETPLAVLTHDKQMALGAMAMGFEVTGAD